MPGETLAIKIRPENATLTELPPFLSIRCFTPSWAVPQPLLEYLSQGYSSHSAQVMNPFFITQPR